MKARTRQSYQTTRVNILFNEHENLARSVAKKVSELTGRPYSELEDEALDILAKVLMEKWQGFDPSKSCESSWIYRSVYFLLLNRCRKMRKRFRREGESIEGMTEEPTHRGPSRLETLFSELGQEGKALLYIISRAPGDLIFMLSPDAPTRSRNAINNYFELVHFGKLRVEKAWSQVETSLYS